MLAPDIVYLSVKSIATVFYFVILIYFFRLFRQNKAKISFYWLVTYASFGIGSIFSVIASYQLNDIDLGEAYYFPFLAFSIGLLAVSFVLTETLPFNLRASEVIMIILTLINTVLAISFALNISTDMNNVFLLFNAIISIFVILGYLYLSHKSRNLRIALVTVAMLIYTILGIIGRIDGAPDLSIRLIIRLSADLILVLGLTAFRKE